MSKTRVYLVEVRFKLRAKPETEPTNSGEEFPVGGDAIYYVSHCHIALSGSSDVKVVEAVAQSNIRNQYAFVRIISTTAKYVCSIGQFIDVRST